MLLSLFFFVVTLFTLLMIFHQRGLLATLSAFSREKLTYRLRIFTWLGSFALFITIWAILSNVEPEGINKIPSPIQTLNAAWKLTISGTLLDAAAISCSRILVGFTMAAIVGVTIGLLSGTFLLANRLIVPVASFLRYIPPTAFISLLIIYFGVGESYKYAVIFLGVVFFIIQMVIDVVEDIDSRYLEMALTTGYNNIRIFKEVVIPASWPRIWDVLRINLSASWTFLVAAELIGAQRGLGHLIAVSQRYLQIDNLYVAILTFGLIGITTDYSLGWLSKVFFRWHYIRSR